jgi:hypothetical protein
MKFNVDIAITRPGAGKTPKAPQNAADKEQLGLLNDNALKSQPIQITELMDVELTSADAGAFDVHPTDAKPKRLPVKGHAEWHWEVTPQQTGNKRLRLHWQSIGMRPDGTLSPPQDLGNAYATITVNVLPWRERIIPATSKFFADNWKSILGGLGVPSAAAIFAAIRAWMKKKRAWRNLNFDPGPCSPRTSIRGKHSMRRGEMCVGLALLGPLHPIASPYWAESENRKWGSDDILGKLALFL